MSATATDQPPTKEELRELYRNFDPVHYMKLYDKGELKPYLAFVLPTLHYIFDNDLVTGTTLLDAGSGPCIHFVISSSRKVTDITLSDLLPQNRDQLFKWIKNDSDAQDWSFAFKHVANLEKESHYKNLEERVRSKIRDVIPIDVYRANPISPTNQQFDIVTSSLCLEAACVNEDQLNEALNNLATLVRPEGHLILGTVFCDQGYTLGDTHFPTLYMEHKEFKEALKKAGFQPESWFIQDVSDLQLNFTEMSVVKARKCR